MALRSRRDQSQQDFERFVTDHSERLLRTAYLIVWDAGEAEDLVQECLARVARRWPRVRAMDQPVAYARRILINLALDGTTRRNRRRGELALESDSGDGVDHAAAVPLTQVEDAVVLLAALGELPPRQRAVLVLRYFEDLTEAQTAELLGCSIGTIKSTTSHAFARLRRDTLHPLRVEPPVPSVKGTIDD